MLIFGLAALIAAGAWWALREPPPSVGAANVPLGETRRQVLEGPDGEPEVWTITKRKAAREEMFDGVIPEPAPRETPPDEGTDSARALDARGLEAWKAGELREAMDLFEAAIAADPDDWVPHANYGRLRMLMTDLKGARPLLLRAAELAPDSPRVWLDLVSMYERSLVFGAAAEARQRAEETARGRAIVQDEFTGLWIVEGDPVVP